jgi:hypothetical protein
MLHQSRADLTTLSAFADQEEGRCLSSGARSPVGGQHCWQAVQEDEAPEKFVGRSKEDVDVHGPRDERVMAAVWRVIQKFRVLRGSPGSQHTVQVYVHTSAALCKLFVSSSIRHAIISVSECSVEPTAHRLLRGQRQCRQRVHDHVDCVWYSTVQGTKLNASILCQWPLVKVEKALQTSE